MSITYDAVKFAFVAVGREINDYIGDLNVHLRSCGEVSNWIFDDDISSFVTRDVGSVADGEFASECDELARSEIRRRQQKAAEPISTIAFKDGRYVALGGGRNARNKLKNLGWSFTPEGLLACENPFIVDISDKYDCLDAAARVEFNGWKAEAERRIASSRAADTAATFPAPAGMEYLPFQRAGIEVCLQPGHKLLGDEMGLGKTIQAIGVANVVKAQRILVVCPASLKINWQREIEVWKAEALPITILDKAAEKAPSGFVIVNYDILNQVHKALNVNWDLLIFDEAHYLKNEETRRTQIAFGETIEQVKQRISKELARTIDKPLKEKSFAKVAALLNTDEANIRSHIDGAERSRLKVSGKAIVKSLGREIVKQLTELERAAGLSATKILFLSGTPIPNRPAELFSLLRWLDPNGLGHAKKKQWFLDRYCDPEFNAYAHTYEYKGASNTDELGRYLRQTFMIRRLKEDVLADLPEKTRQIMEIEPDSKAKKLIREESECAARRDAIGEILNSSFHDQIKKLHVELGRIEENLSTLRKEIGVEKVPHVVEHVNLCFENGVKKVVVMAHHHEVITLLMERLKAFSPVKLDGEMSLPARQESIDRFQSDPDCRVFIGSLLAASVGITLTAASTVVFAEMDWVSGTMQQAESRCHRISQHDNVLAQYLVYSGSLDAIMCKTLRKKEIAIESALGDSLVDVEALPMLSPKESLVGVKTVNGPVSEPQKIQKRGRGRPKVYQDTPAPSATERSKRSVRALTDAGGKRVMLRLSPDAHDALKTIMALTGRSTETDAINQTLIAWKRELLNAEGVARTHGQSNARRHQESGPAD